MWWSLQVPQPGPPSLLRGKQVFEAAPEGQAPLGKPIEKERVLLQVSKTMGYV